VGLPSERRVQNVDRDELMKQRGRYFRTILRAARLNTMAALAAKLEVSPSTLANIRSAKRSAGPELIEKIKQLAPRVGDAQILSAEAVDNLAEPTPEARLSIAQRLAQDYGGQIQKLQELRVEEDPDTNIEEIRRNFDAMNKDDVFIYVSAITPPLEMDPNEIELKAAIANAIQRQAFFLYLTPTKKYLQEVGDFVDISALFANFKREVMSNISDESIQDQCRQRLLLIQTDANSLFTLPNFKWELFHSNTFDVPYKAAAGALVVAGLAPNYIGPKVRIPLPVTATKQVLFEIARTICLANPNLPVSDQVPLDVVTRLKESAELAARKKINPS
jgi:transcriptional regulator with XRE-family HTH domain